MKCNWKPQLLLHFHHYLRAADWAKLEDPNISHHGKCQVLYNLMNDLSLWQLEENTVRYAVAFLVEVSGKDMPPPSQAYGLVQDFKKGWDAARRQRVGTYVAKYPTDPKDLPADVYSRAYSEGLPAPKDFPTLGHTAKSIPLRNTHVGVRKESQSSCLTPSTPSVADAVTWSQLSQFFMSGFGNNSSSSASGSGGLNLLFPAAPAQQRPVLALPSLCPPALPMMSPLALPEPPAAAELPATYTAEPPFKQPFQSEGEASVKPARISSEAYEQAMLEALNGKKRKSSGSAATAFKRPAMAEPTACSSGYVVTWDPAALDKKVANFTSKHYHGAAKHAARMGFSEEEQKEAAQNAYKAAKELWDSKQ